MPPFFYKLTISSKNKPICLHPVFIFNEHKQIMNKSVVNLNFVHYLCTVHNK